MSISTRESLEIGQRVQLRPTRYSGVISYLGEPQFAEGYWIGVTLDKPNGKNDGSVNGVKYFECDPKHGIFVRPDKIDIERKKKKREQIPVMQKRAAKGKI
jgi:dynactin complex subunit